MKRKTDREREDEKEKGKKISHDPGLACLCLARDGEFGILRICEEMKMPLAHLAFTSLTNTLARAGNRRNFGDLRCL